jgi:alpha-L-fucosidase 2
LRHHPSRLDPAAADPGLVQVTELELWYRQPAVEWTDALPVGNGRLGAMIFGSVGQEHLQLNEETLWTGGPYTPVNPEAKDHLDEVRRLILAGRYAEAEALADEHLMARPLKQMAFQPAGDLWIDVRHDGPVENYRRSLDLDRAVATVAYETAGVRFTRETFSSAVDQVLVVRLTADRPGSVEFAVGLTSEQPGALIVNGHALEWRGRNRDAEGIAGRLSFAMRAQVTTHGGQITTDGERLRVTGANEALILLDVATSFRRFDDVGGDPVGAVASRLAAASSKDFATLLDAHLRDYRGLFRRLSIDLGAASSDVPTDARIAANPRSPDPALAALYVQFGRYLMISSSRPGTQPATLQGIWNKEKDPPWGSKYTANINLQMNYWLPDAANLGECIEPLLGLAEGLAVTGAEMARAHYGARGWVMHHNTDLWRATGPVDGAKWGLWPTGGAWVCAQLWDHLRYDWNEEAAKRLYPLMAGATRFILDILVPLPGTNYLVTVPSLSPENAHPYGAALCAGPTMDNQIIRDLFDAVIELSLRFGADAEFREEVETARVRLSPHRIGKAGQLQEWLEDWDMDVPEIHHRHVSHLYGLYPSLQIDADTTPDLAAAARRSLEIRGDEATGWGIGWRINLWARLRDGDRANAVVTRLLSPDRTYPNMFDAHPPFQIDGNFGGAAGILEMLVQSKPGEVRLLPALPTAWPDGRLTGVRARGGIEVDVEWSAGRLVSAALRAASAVRVAARCGQAVCALELEPNREARLRMHEGVLQRI